MDSSGRATPVVAVRCRTAFPLRGERAARGLETLEAPLEAVDDALVAAREGTVEYCGPASAYFRTPGSLRPSAVRDLGDVVLLPGAVNCHTHLELSHMAGKTVTGRGFVPWVSSLLALESRQAMQGSATPDNALDPTRAASVGMNADQNPLSAASVRDNAATAVVHTPDQALDLAFRLLAASGTAAVGDIAGRRPVAVVNALRAGRVTGRVFQELIGSNPDLRAAQDAAVHFPEFSLAGHALYSTSPEILVRAREWCTARDLPFSLHLAEHPDETEVLTTGRGSFHDLLARRVLPPEWRAPGTTPVRLAASLGLLGPGTMAVHCVHCDEEEIGLLAGAGAVCLCPRSNALIAVGEAPVATLACKGALLCLGTDSLASNADLDVWNEVSWLLEKNVLPPKSLLRMATVNGAAALGLSWRAGTLERGKGFCYRVFPSGVLDALR